VKGRLKADSNYQCRINGTTVGSAVGEEKLSLECVSQLTELRSFAISGVL
jgi:hypothetical protein